MTNCNPCKKEEQIAPCAKSCKTRRVIDECTGEQINYITTAAAVLLSCNSDKTVDDILSEINSRLSEIETNYSREAIEDIINEYFELNGFANLRDILNQLFEDWSTEVSNMIITLKRAGISEERFWELFNQANPVRTIMLNGVSYTPAPNSDGFVNLGNLESSGLLNTNNSGSLPVGISEPLSGNINLHKVSKTGKYEDLIGRPTKLSDFEDDLDSVVDIQLVPEFPDNMESNVLYVKHPNLGKYAISKDTDYIIPDIVDIKLLDEIIKNAGANSLTINTLLSEYTIEISPRDYGYQYISNNSSWTSFDVGSETRYRKTIEVTDRVKEKIRAIVSNDLHQEITDDTNFLNRKNEIKDDLNKITGRQIKETLSAKMKTNGVVQSIQLKDNKIYHDPRYNVYFKGNSFFGHIVLNEYEKDFFNIINIQTIWFLNILGVPIYVKEHNPDVNASTEIFILMQRLAEGKLSGSIIVDTSDGLMMYFANVDLESLDESGDFRITYDSKQLIVQDTSDLVTTTPNITSKLLNVDKFTQLVDMFATANSLTTMTSVINNTINHG